MDKTIDINTAIDMVKDGDIVMIGGFLGAGAPELLIDKLVEKGIKNLTLIANDTGWPDRAHGKLVVNKQFKKIIASHVGTNRETGNQMASGETEVVLVPQGTLVEQVRAASHGLGGVLTPTGLGTDVEKGKDKIVVDGKEYLVEKPLRANVALLFANKVDKFGNMNFYGATRNFNNMMAGAADITIVEAAEIVEIGELDPNTVHTPGVFVDYIVDGGKK
ncbi:CoA transferase subunit A [Fundicoccus culcitae]|uniref:CoA transferase subunit A n=1 Tax=Fundicoccus culcitae TaxID=2969821 RepID=A0ABY5P582_9LACT|nr:CoA transferase subunit A [Fundicoccus culcitae]UUX33635.1 CoA transferase subunit A [Fundicoccus culcitae]